MPERKVTVRTGARLHFGPLSYLPERGRHFGGIGLMVDEPGVVLSARLVPDGQSSRSNVTRARQILDAIYQGRPQVYQPVEVEVEHQIPPHCGLGSGTQLALAVTDAVSTLHGVNLSAAELAKLSGRGERSAIGLIGYEQGGFLIDAGRHESNECGVLASRVTFPQEWKILLIRGKTEQGLFGEEEVAVFRKLQPMSEAISGRLCRLALTEILPALLTQDFSAFTAAVHEFGSLVGRFFAKTQNGIFSTEIMRDLATRLPTAEIGMAQSSWGPTIAMFAPNTASAEELTRELQKDRLGNQLVIQPVTARNVGRERFQ